MRRLNFLTVFLLSSLGAADIIIAPAQAQNWTLTSATNAEWAAVACSADGTKLAAVVFSDGIYTSTNSGASWQESGAPALYWDCIACSADGSRLIAAGDGNLGTS